MVKVTIELSKLEIEMLINCIDSALDVKHTPDIKRAEEIRDQLKRLL